MIFFSDKIEKFIPPKRPQAYFVYHTRTYRLEEYRNQYKFGSGIYDKRDQETMHDIFDFLIS